jgi:hypothetical protein
MGEQKVAADTCLINKRMVEEIQHTLGEHSLRLIYIKVTKVEQLNSHRDSDEIIFKE